MDCIFDTPVNLGDLDLPDYEYSHSICIDDASSTPAVTAGFTIGEIMVSYLLFLILVVLVGQMIYRKWII